MNEDTNSIHSLLLKIRALADDPRAPAGERAAAAAKLSALMLKHGLSAQDLTDSTLVQYAFNPRPRNPQERKLAVQLTAMILNSNKVTVYTERKNKNALSAECTKAQAADLGDAWEHYIPIFRKNWKKVKAEAAAVLKAGYGGFLHRFMIFPDKASEGPPPTQEQIDEALAAMRAARSMEGRDWTPRHHRIAG